jgi:hypothetical protein
MQTEQTKRMAKKILKLREKKPPMLWREICIRLNIYKADGTTPDTGLASKIAYQGVEPATKRVRDRLGMRGICLTCRRPFRKPGKVRAKVLKSEPSSWWGALQEEERERIMREFSKSGQHG